MASDTLRDLLLQIEAHGGPQGLDLSGAGLTELDAGLEVIQAELAQLRATQPAAQPAWLSPITGGLNLSRAILRHANLSDADLRGADLGEADLEGAVLADVDLRQANLQGASLRAARLHDIDLRQASLQGANLEQAQLDDGDLRGANLAGANLRAARLHDADLRDALLEGANLAEADLEDARFDWGRGRRGRRRHSEWPALADELRAQVMAEVDTWASPERLAAFADEVRAGLGEGPSEWTSFAPASTGQPAGEAVSWSIPREGATTLRLSVGLGSIRLVAEERDDILLQGTAEACEELEMARSGGAVHIRQRRHSHNRAQRLDLEVALPQALQRLQVRTGLGSIHGRAIAAQVRCTTGQGDIRFAESRLEGDARTGSGNIALAQVQGRVTLRTGSGNVLLQDAAQAILSISTGRGKVQLEGGHVQEMRIHTGMGDVRSACALGPGACEVHTGAGAITLELAEGQAAQIEASTGMGQVASDWPLVRVGRPGPAAVGSMRMVGSIGGEAQRALITLKTGMGNIHLRRSGATASAPADTPTPEPARPPAPGVTYEDARLAILQSLSRGEISAAEAEELINALGA